MTHRNHMVVQTGSVETKVVLYVSLIGREDKGKAIGVVLLFHGIIEFVLAQMF
jgi:hypothetical protein